MLQAACTKTHLHNAGARVKEDAAFGFLGDLLVFVEIHDVGVVCQLGELKVSPLERLCGQEEGGGHWHFFVVGVRMEAKGEVCMCVCV